MIPGNDDDTAAGITETFTIALSDRPVVSMTINLKYIIVFM